MREVSTHEVISALLKAVAEKGYDYVYRRSELIGCVNFEGDGPSCLVGNVYYQLGLTFVDLDVPEHDPEVQRKNLNGAGHSTVKDFLVRQKVMSFSRRANRILLRVQDLQDTGTPWGEAVTNALTLYRIED